MKGPALKLAALLASVAGYYPAPPDCVRGLKELRGEFRRSRSEIIFRWITAGLFVALGAFLAGMAYGKYFGASSASGALIPGILAFVLVGLALGVISTIPHRYEFNSGRVSMYGWRNKLMWQEELGDLQTVMCTSTRGIIWMTLRWPRRKRSIELLDKLAEALSVARPALRGRQRSS